jgi:hypothetical protein
MNPNIYEPTLFREQPILYLPASGTIITGRGLGPDWAGDGVGVVSHPALGAGFTTQFPRTRITSAAGPQNQELGAHLPNASDARAWRGNAASRGGFYFASRFMVNAIPNNSIRLFCGLSVATAGVCKQIFSAIPNNTVGLWCDTGDSASLTIVVVDNAGGRTNVPMALVNGTPQTLTLTAGVLYEFVMLANPNQNTIVTYISDISAGTLLRTQNVNASTPPNTGIPLNTAFMAPQVGLSNGTANTAGGDCSLDLISAYLRPNLKLTPTGSP